MSKHRDVLEKIQWCRLLHNRTKPRFTRALRNALNQGVIDASGNPAPTPHGVYVDDNIYLDVADTHRFEQAIASSIEAVFVLLGEPNPTL